MRSGPIFYFMGEPGSSSQLTGDGKSTKGQTSNSESDLQRMVSLLVKQAMDAERVKFEAERAKTTATVGTSQTGSHSLSGRRISSVHSPTCGMTSLGSLLQACMYGPSMCRSPHCLLLCVTT